MLKDAGKKSITLIISTRRFFTLFEGVGGMSEASRWPSTTASPLACSPAWIRENEGVGAGSEALKHSISLFLNENLARALQPTPY